MYELIKVSDSTFYIESPAKIGIVKLSENEVCLIDSGNDKDAGKKALKIIKNEGWTLKAIFNTHSHADHIGGNKYLETETGCKIYAPGIECDFTKHTILEPAFLNGGYPHAALKHKFLLAKESTALPLTEESMEGGLEIINLPGHSFDMVGFKTADGIVFLADALSSRDTLDKYKIGFIYDVAAYLETLEAIKSISARLFIPSHAEPTKDITALADYNIKTVYEIKERILSVIDTAKPFDTVIKELFDGYGLSLSAEQYALVGSTVRSYLSWLKDLGEADIRITDNMLLWERCNEKK